MAEYLIRDAEGREVRRETTPNDVIGPLLGNDETAELVTEPKPRAKRAADSDK